MKLTPQRIVLIIILIIGSAVFWFGTSEAAPYDATPCKLSYDRALALVHGSDHIADVSDMVGEWAMRPTTNTEDFYGLPRVVTVTLFAGEHFAGLIDVRGRGDVLRVHVRGAKALETCWSGEIDAAIVQGWLTSPIGQE